MRRANALPRYRLKIKTQKHTMTAQEKILPLLQRVTSSGKKLLYIDGLRFFAVISVFLFHFIDYYDDQHVGFITKYRFIQDYLQGSVMGVILFFSISGFLIAMPFYSSYADSGQKFSLRDYYIRRLTRLEPPYIIHLILLFVLTVFILKTKTFSWAFPHLLASIFYSHEIIYGEMPVLNTVLWTLEIEIQFYIMAPLLALVFRLPRFPRRIALLTLISIFMFWKPVLFDFPSVLNYIHYFLTGFLALDVCMQFRDRAGKYILFDVACFSSLALLWFSAIEFVTGALLFVLLVCSPRTKYFIKILEHKIVYTIGGMCYSIYMLHQKVIYMVHAVFLRHTLIGNSYLTDFFVRLFYTLIFTLLVSAVFFILVERPTMKKLWWRYRSLRKLVAA
ncbi:acyltransferase [Epilithonimonas sp. JDS]|uniref:acyltransferase family protein n=1 Tax=Epilithonimonas sp. JDS TaxID=2902797 RepID=UPI001E5F6053|nr:acyltransferase [Epilithonimonas sp. JDS]MCD9855159.1 acyltransferase [Epilithonimonas sp. JDS]